MTLLHWTRRVPPRSKGSAQSDLNGGVYEGGCVKEYKGEITREIIKGDLRAASLREGEQVATVVLHAGDLEKVR